MDPGKDVGLTLKGGVALMTDMNRSSFKTVMVASPAYAALSTPVITTPGPQSIVMLVRPKHTAFTTKQLWRVPVYSLAQSSPDVLLETMVYRP
jgi:hypothetical protein